MPHSALPAHKGGVAGGVTNSIDPLYRSLNNSHTHNFHNSLSHQQLSQLSHYQL